MARRNNDNRSSDLNREKDRNADLNREKDYHDKKDNHNSRSSNDKPAKSKGQFIYIYPIAYPNDAKLSKVNY